jgi:hypothetical protein
MAKNTTEYRHFFTIKSGVWVWEEPDMFALKRNLLEGKRGFAIIEEVQEDWTRSQLAFYWGGIIHGECMKSQCFSGLRDHEIHNILWDEYSSHTVIIQHADGKTEKKIVSDDWHAIGKKEMKGYIDFLIPHLLTEYGIIVKDPSVYKNNKFIIKKRKV